jgi:hypothetical protein
LPETGNDQQPDASMNGVARRLLVLLGVGTAAGTGSLADGYGECAGG